MQNAIINGLCRLSISHDYQCDCRAYKALIVSAKPKTYRTLCQPYAVVYKLYSLRPLINKEPEPILNSLNFFVATNCRAASDSCMHVHAECSRACSCCYTCAVRATLKTGCGLGTRLKHKVYICTTVQYQYVCTYMYALS